MSLAVTREPRVVHASRGRMRVHLPGWEGSGQRSIENQLRRAQGVYSSQANPLTGNVLIRFDPAATDDGAILGAVQALETETAGAPEEEKAPPPPALRERRRGAGHARITVRGLEREPQLARRVIEHLQGLSGVRRASASQLTGRVLVEFDEHQIELEDLVSEVSGIELPDTIGEDHPSHPLDPKPLIKSGTQLVGASLGLGLLAARRLGGIQGPPLSGAAEAASVVGLLDGFPATREGLRSLLGRHTADLLFAGTGVLALTLSGNPLGLALSGAGALRLFTEVYARRVVFRRYEERLEDASSAQPGAVIRLESGERTPLTAEVIEGTGTAGGRDGLPVPVAPGQTVDAGARLYGGPFVLELKGDRSFTPEARPAPVPKSLYERYTQASGLLSLGYAALTAVLTRSFSRTFMALVLVNPRTAVIGKEGADTGASARVLRSGVTVVGTRQDRIVRLPDVLLLDGPRTLTDGLEISSTLPLGEDRDASEILSQAAGVAAASGSPWGRAFASLGRVEATSGSFDGKAAGALIGNTRYSLYPPEARDQVPTAMHIRSRGEYVLLLKSEREEHPLGVFALRPKLATGATEMIQTCRRQGVEIGLLGAADDPLAAQAVARRAEVPLLPEGDAVSTVRARQEEGALVALVSDSAGAAEAFEACDLAVGLSSGRSGHFPARADLLAPDLSAVAAIIDAGARRDAAVRDSVGLSIISNVFGAAWGLEGRPGARWASTGTYVAALSALAVGWARLRGGKRPRSTAMLLADPNPERWGRRSIADVLRELQSTEEGLTSAQVAERRRAAPPVVRRSGLLSVILDQLRSPLTGLLAAGAGLSLILGSAADVAVIGAVIAANAVAGAWQEHQAGQAARALKRLSAPTARVLRDGRAATVPAAEVVPGDVLLLAPGDRVAADARLISAEGLEVDEAALTGESLPVSKAATGGTDASRVVLEGSDVTVGTGSAAVMAVGRDTRIGATAAALSLEETKESPLGARLNKMLRQVLPLTVLGGGIVTASGVLWGRPLLRQLATGASIALAALPEGLPLLAAVGEGAVARRLAGRNALVTRLAAVEALGRVDVVCTDKTGTLTEGHLAVSMVADVDQQIRSLSGELTGGLRRVLLTAAIASPSPDASDATSHPTDVAVVRGAEEVGLGEELRMKREAETPFDPVRAFHATVAGDRLCVKGAPEGLIRRCTRVRRDEEERPLDEAGQRELLATARRLAERGLRVLAVAEGQPENPTDDPQNLVALGFLGLSDPLRPAVPAAVHRCREAGIRVIMLTGDHPATARAIAREAGIPGDGRDVVTATEIAGLEDGGLDLRLQDAAVIARITPLDKLRIVESLRRNGHTVAMTGDGVNDAPALRLADVGVAMGRNGTEVARQTADVVLADDNFSTLVEALVEGRGFWRNIRRALGLLLGGNLGELGLLVGASIPGFASPLTVRQILTVNLVTDVLPALAVALQQPEHRDLTALAREGTAGLGTPLRNDILRRGIATAAPALAAHLLALRSGGMPEARSVAFASIVATQLAQTLDAGRAEGGLSRSVLGAVVGSTGLLVGTFTVGPLRDFLALATPGPFGWILIGAGALVAVPLGRVLALPRLALPASLGNARVV